MVVESFGDIVCFSVSHLRINCTEIMNKLNVPQIKYVFNGTIVTCFYYVSYRVVFN